MIETTELSSASTPWLQGLTDRVYLFLDRLRNDPQNPGRYLPCVVGVTEVGLQMSLGNCCFAVKTLFTINRWQSADTSFQQAHVDLIRSFQLPQASRGIRSGSFVDWPIWQTVRRRDSWSKRIQRFAFRRNEMSPTDRLSWAETKQAWSTLKQVGAPLPTVEFAGLPQTLDALDRILGKFNWKEPWGAGGQFSCVATLLSLSPKTQEQLGPAWRSRLIDHVNRIADPLTGTYFDGPRPEQGQLINGAMKVLTALTWLGHPIHYPDRLIDTCLRKPPEASGCHLVDVVYVLDQCLAQVDYRRDDIQLFAEQVLSQLSRHHLRDGGFSYHVGKSQTTYYGATIAQGLPESDLHATCLLTWAVSLCEHILGRSSQLGWKVIQP